MEIRKTYKYRLYTSKRDRHLHRQIGIAGHIWNHCIALHRRYYRLTGKYISAHQLKGHIAKLKQQPRFAHWQQLDAQAAQDVVERVDKAYQRFFDGLENGRKFGRPGFKKVRKYKSFTLKQTSWKLLGGNKIRIRGRNYKFVKHREIGGVIKTVTIKRDNANRLWLCLSVIEEVPEPNEASTGKSGGFDFGLKTFLTDDSGRAWMMPQYFKSELKQVARLNRELARKRRGSNHRRKAKIRLAKAHARLTDKRRDFHFKLAHRLCDEYDVLYFEDLNIKGMQQLWGRKINDLGFAQFIGILEYVAQQRGVEVSKIDRWEPTTQTCSQCGARQAMPLRERTYCCPECSLKLNRDHNAALNILRAGTSAHSLEVVRHPAGAALLEARSPRL